MSNSKNTTRIKQMFSGLQRQMITDLETIRETIEHAPSMGSALEEVWIEWLKKYLPNRYSVDSAFIIDHTGAISEQIDLVIYDQQYTPFIFEQKKCKFIPAEGVYAVFEVKPDLQGSSSVKGKSMSYIEYASQKIGSVRKLLRTSTMIVDRGVQKDPRSLTKIIGGIITSENTFEKEITVENHFKKCVGLQSIDIGCSASGGSFYINYEGDEDVQISDLSKRIESYYTDRVFQSIQYSEKDESLVIFFLQLSRYLQQSIGTVAAIDLNSYAKNLNFDIDKEI